MTEADWLTCTDPLPMLELLRGKASERKLRLFFCACCRGEQYAVCPQGLAAVGVAEAFADGLADETVRADAARLIQSLLPDEGDWSAYSLIAWSLHKPIGGSYPLDYVMMWAIPSVVQAHLASSDEITSLLRDLFGNPFRHVTIAPSWRVWNDGTIIRLAQGIYDERAFDRLPILADALEESGCTNADILAHCRLPCEHVRGCWVLDLLLGKS
ncbi:MAG TPA: hypothetical protein VMG10_34725 [Gemmataceae bacterium]|nr:hypothetical protein [Gemmataceae bacterium]